MSELTPTDLICKSRREPLSEAESRRLKELVATNVEARLLHLMGPELERLGRMQRGDDALALRIAERALAVTSGGVRCGDDALALRIAERTSASVPRIRKSRLPKVNWLMAAAILLGATAAAGAWWRVQAGQERGAEGAGMPPASASVHREARRLSTSPMPVVSSTEEPIEFVVPLDLESLPNAVRRPIEDNDRKSGPVATAAGLFSRANRLRREDRAVEAVQLYRTIISAHAQSREAPLARLALAKVLSTSQPREALSHYKALARSRGALRAEALWGIAEAAVLLNDDALRKSALVDLLREFPDSPYAAVARANSRDAN